MTPLNSYLKPFEGLVPIVLAISGHRDIPSEDVALLVQVVSAQLRDISARHPYSPCLMLTGLAEGADRLVARCALDAGWSIGVMLPLPQNDYETDFQNEQSVAEFRGLLARAIWVRELTDGSVGRPECYRKLGEWLAQQAQVLLALWDGKPGEGAGGTADVVQIFREGLSLDRPILPDAGPVIHVLTRRLRDLSGVPSEAIGSSFYLPAQPAGLPSAGEKERWNDVLDRIDQFNAHARQANFSNATGIALSAKQLPHFDGEGDGNSVSAARRLFAVSDALSTTAQSERSLMFKGLLALSALAIFLGQLYSGPLEYPALISGAILISLVGFLWYSVSVRSQLESRYLDYRALAEASRVQYFWKMAGIRDSAADHYLREQRDELEWIRQAIQTTELEPPAKAEISEASTRLKYVRDTWIDAQLRYFAGDKSQPGGKAAYNRAMDERWSLRTRWLFLAGVGVTMVTALYHGFFATPGDAFSGQVVQDLILLYGLIFSASGVSKVFQETQAYAEHANRYQRMAISFELARKRIDAALASGNVADGVLAVKAIGIEALAENGDWLLIHRERPVTVQVGN